MVVVLETESGLQGMWELLAAAEGAGHNSSEPERHTAQCILTEVSETGDKHEKYQIKQYISPILHYFIITAIRT